MSEPDRTDSGWVEVASCPWLHEAELLVSVLDAAAIPATIPNEYLLGVQPFYAPIVGGVRVLVRSEDAARAREILAATDQGAIGETADPASTRCVPPRGR